MDSYASGTSNRVLAIDIWAALAAGLWSSSVVLTIRGATDGAAASTGTLTAQPNAAGPNPAAQTKAIALAAGAAGACPATSVATLTVFDDGTFTLT